MPSKSEPCGLSQMIASRYGSVPLVRRTGGLADSIVDFTVKGNGYTFDNIDAGEMYIVLKRAIADFYDQDGWAEKVKKVNFNIFKSRCASAYSGSSFFIVSFILSFIFNSEFEISS